MSRRYTQFLFFWMCPWHVEFPGPRIEPSPWQRPKPRQWQRPVLNPLCATREHLQNSILKIRKLKNGSGHPGSGKFHQVAPPCGSEWFGAALVLDIGKHRFLRFHEELGLHLFLEFSLPSPAPSSAASPSTWWLVWGHSPHFGSGRSHAREGGPRKGRCDSTQPLFLLDGEPSFQVLWKGGKVTTLCPKPPPLRKNYMVWS